MRNLYVSTYLAPYRLDLCTYLHDKCGFEIFHYMEDTDNCFSEEELMEGAGFVNHHLPTRRLMGKSYAPGLKALLEQYRPEVVMVQEFSLICIQLLHYRKRFGYRLLSICDDSIDMIEGNDFSLTHRMARKMIPSKVDDVIVHSPETLRWYGEHFGKGMMMPIIPDEKRFRDELVKARERSEALRETLGPSGTRLIVFVGRVVGLKNIPLLLEAFSALGRDDVRLVIIGDGDKMDMVRKTAGRNVSFTGPVGGKELYAWYNLADILVLPSYREAFGAVVGEALISGCLAVVSDKVGSSSLIREGENGYLFTSDSAVSLREKLSAALDSLGPRPELSLRPCLLPCSFGECISNLKI